MATNSGIILDSNSNLGVPGVSIIAITGSLVYANAITKPVGVFSITVPSTDIQVTYIPYKMGYRGYSKTISSTINFLNLYVKTELNIVPSGNNYINLNNNTHSTSSNVIDVKTTATHFYAITDYGMDIIDANTLNNVGYIKRPGGFTCMCLNKDAAVLSGIYLGTSDSGVYQFIIPETYSNTNRDYSTSSSYTNKYSTSGNKVVSNNIQCMDLNLNGDLIIGSVSGIDTYINTFSGIVGSGGVTVVNHYNTNYNSSVGTTACAISEYRDVQYSPTNSGMYCKHTVSGNWSIPDYIVCTTGINPFPIYSDYINNIKITSISGANEVFIATQSGILCYKDNSDLNISASGSKVFINIP